MENDWGWGVVVHVKKHQGGQGTLPSILKSSKPSFYCVDTLLHCSSTVAQDKTQQKPKPCPKGEMGELKVVRLMFPCLFVEKYQIQNSCSFII